ncbi:6-phosphogluconolactonase [Stieleria maiorica]|uniref:6-phosphogluconolactonase n=1 Tax=Stieleria maiorica TaxID=2795974 RepID=A0A5B9MMB9_9BACT|nr:6-phosphogluconolactonase [Stieleria maiorica]QEG00656.1 6-phosphogluconolactonase [Stieleria maiorica]
MQYPFEPFADTALLQQAVTDSFCQLAEQTVAKNGVFRVSLSGGSTPRRVYEMLSQRELPWDRIHWFWGDERNVPHDHDDSNFRMVHTALLSKVDIPPQNIHAVPVDVESPAKAAEQYEQTLRQHFHGPVPDWDLVLLGMGDDAHTASLFPDTLGLGEQKRWFIENWVPKFDAFRYTMTYPAIESARNTWFIITGEAKQDALKQVLFGAEDPARYPSQRIRPTRWFVDAAACG